MSLCCSASSPVWGGFCSLILASLCLCRKLPEVLLLPGAPSGFGHIFFFSLWLLSSDHASWCLSSQDQSVQSSDHSPFHGHPLSSHTSCSHQALLCPCHCSSHPCCSQLWLCQSSQLHFSQSSLFWVLLPSSSFFFPCHLVGFGWWLPLLLLSGGDGLSQSGEDDEDCLILALFKA